MLKPVIDVDLPLSSDAHQSIFEPFGLADVLFLTIFTLNHIDEIF